MADFNVACSQCNTLLQVNTELIGSMVQCPTCGNTFTVTAPMQQAPALMQQAPAPQFTPQFQAPAADTTGGFAAKAGNAANAARNILKKGNASTGMAALALVIALISLIYSIFFTNSFPKMSFSKDPEKACKKYLAWAIETGKTADYSVRKNGSEVLSSFEVAETLKEGDFAVVLYKLSRKSTTVKEAIYLKKNKDGYYLNISKYKFEKDASKSFAEKVERKVKSWEKDSDDKDDLFE